MSAKTVTTPTAKPGAQATELLNNISTSTARLVYTPPVDETSDSAPGPSAQQQNQDCTAGPIPSGSQQPSEVHSKSKPASKSTRDDSPSESSESSDAESLAAYKPKTTASHARGDSSPAHDTPTAFALASAKSTAPSEAAERASTALSSKNANVPKFNGPSQPKPANQWSNEEVCPSTSQASFSRTAPPPAPSQASNKSRPHRNSQTVSNRTAKEKPVDSSDESFDGEERPTASQATPPPPGLLSLAEAPLADLDLDAVIRGPRVSVLTRDLPSSDSSDDEEAEDALVDAEGLAEDDEPKVSRRVSKMFNAAAVGSSDEGETDGGDSDSGNGDGAAQRPPRLALSAVAKHSTDEANDQSAQSSPVDHGNLSFGDVNGMASSVEIDAQGDRAFSEALADDTAVFNLAAQNIEDSSHESSGHATPGNHFSAQDQDDEDEDEETAIAKEAKDERHDSIEPFDSPVPMQAPRSPIVNADFLQSTPRGLRSRMKGKNGKVPQLPHPAPNSSLQKAIKLWNGMTKAEAAKKAGATAKAKVTAPPPLPAEQGLEEGSEPEAEKPTGPKRAAAPKPPRQIHRSQKAATQPPASQKHLSKTTLSSEALPATQPTPAITPRTTRAAWRAASAQPSPLPTQAMMHHTQESVHKWATLPSDSSLQFDETMNMVDELQSLPGEGTDEERLFIASETQQSFPYSQWRPQSQFVKQKEAKSSNWMSEDEDEDEVEHAVTKTTPIGTKKPPATLRFPSLSQIASQTRSFRTSLPTPGVPKSCLDSKKRHETMADLYGAMVDDEPSDGSGSDAESDSDAEKPSPKSHIPKSRRAGVRTRA